jgi:hypothetical protein
MSIGGHRSTAIFQEQHRPGCGEAFRRAGNESLVQIGSGLEVPLVDIETAWRSEVAVARSLTTLAPRPGSARSVLHRDAGFDKTARAALAARYPLALR